MDCTRLFIPPYLSMEQQPPIAPTWGNWVSVWLTAMRAGDLPTLTWLAYAPPECYPYGINPASGSGCELVALMAEFRREVPEFEGMFRHMTYSNWRLDKMPAAHQTGGTCFPCGKLVLRSELHEPSCIPHRIDAKTGEDVFRGAYCKSCRAIADRVAYQDTMRAPAAANKKNPRGNKDKTS